MSNSLRSLLHTFVPSHFDDPVGLAGRMVRSGDRAAIYAMATAALGMAATPLDLVLQVAEKRRYRKAPQPELPLIFVCGPPRSGTTVVAQVLIKNLPVAYINNLTAIFPRSPVVANVIFGKLIKRREIEYRSYYGRTLHLSGPNDGLYLWDRWFGKDRKRVPSGVSELQRREMVAFFGAFEQVFKLPLVTKNNSLNTFAHLVASALDNAYFICLTREAPYLAQSLLKARVEMYGDQKRWYGVEDPERRGLSESGDEEIDPIEDVCRQVVFHDRVTREQHKLIGADRFWVIRYEDFCERPGALVERVSREILGQPVDFSKIEAASPFEAANQVKLEAEVFERINRTLVRLQQPQPVAGVMSLT